MTSISRRDFLRQAGAGALALMACPTAWQARPALADVAPGKRLIFIFLRGGNDALNTVIPHGDSAYSPAIRPTLYIAPETAWDLNGFASLHPAMQKLHEVFTAGDLAVLHRIGYADQNRSHFSSQHFWENALPGDLDLEEGWLYRLVADDGALSGHPLPAASIADQLQLMFKGSGLVLPQFSSIAQYRLDYALEDKLIGRLPDQGNRGLLALYGRTPGTLPYDNEIHYNGRATFQTLEIVSGVNPAGYAPEGGATYPSQAEPGDFPGNSRAWSFFNQLKNGVQLMKEADLRFFGVDLGSFDTHSNQSAAHADRLHILSHGIRSLMYDLQPSGLWADTLVVAASEFGRTTEQNVSLGTDHGEAGAMFVAGGDVIGDVYNAPTGPGAEWVTGPGGAMFEARGRYLSHRTDFRAVYAEIITHMAGVPAPNLDAILPGWSGLSGPTFDFLNFLA